MATQRRGRAQRAQRFLARGVRRAFAAGENERGVPTRRRTGVDDEFVVFLGRIVPGDDVFTTLTFSVDADDVKRRGEHVAQERHLWGEVGENTGPDRGAVE